MKKINIVIIILLMAASFAGFRMGQGEEILPRDKEIDTNLDIVYEVKLDEEYLEIDYLNEIQENLIPLALVERVFDGTDLEKIKKYSIKGGDYILAEDLEKASDLKILAEDKKTIIETEGYVNGAASWKEKSLEEGTIEGNVFLVNKFNSIPGNFAKPDIVDIKSEYLKNIKSGMQLSQEAIDSLEEMGKAYTLDYPGEKLILVSTYRPYSYQEFLFKRKINYYKQSMSEEEAIKKAGEIVAIPGTSEHQSGLAIDFSEMGLIKKGTTLVDEFMDTKEGQWLFNHSPRYGFILRYPLGKMDYTAIVYEAWHYRFVGLPHSQIIADKGLTLEEYLEKLQSEKFIQTSDYRVIYISKSELPIVKLHYNSDRIKIEDDNLGGLVISQNE